ncbi:Protein disulfide isomerase-like 5-4 [Apostasia shenzhenica]|uniref:Protein disulfide isomerase-like 5-4 n=1 Tax=Apostasia shenzhenica TaxID=1088818 RepID=A0A2I0B219_9ASPA|nr:Protein disulfide isomerase-like 5-4 [Apostasia shenzhenica]
MQILNKLKNLDAYPKINNDFYNRTRSGGLITVVSSFVIFFLFLSEIRLYLYSATETKLIVDTSRGERLHVNFDITFPHLACSLVSVDTMDVGGEQHYDITHDIVKRRIDYSGNVIESRQDGIGAPKIERPLQKHGGRLEHGEAYCGSCFGAERSDDQCCNSCEEVQEAYKNKGWAITNIDLIDQCKREGFVQKIKQEKGEGCSIKGFLEVSKVAGNFHFACVKNFHQHDPLAPEMLDLKLENLNVVPTIYSDIRGQKIHSNQFSVTEHYRDGNTLTKAPAGIYFFYDFSPIKVIFTEENKSFLHFVTSVCAVVGGVFTVAGIIDSFVYHGRRAIKKKAELGKFR